MIPVGSRGQASDSRPGFADDPMCSGKIPAGACNLTALALVNTPYRQGEVA